MAWRSSGANHTALIDNLKRHGLIVSPSVEDAFRNVDRKLFVPKVFDPAFPPFFYIKGHEEYAYLDQPLKDGDIHISAPHMYATIVESMELEKNTPLSFLNVGSGTGYLSCIFAHILGPRSTNYGVEISQAVVRHSTECISRWKSSTHPVREHLIEIINGNGLQIDPNNGEGRIGFDRIYIGASIEKSDLSKFTQLLRPGGIMVAPVEDELVKIVRLPHIPNADTTMQVASSDDTSSQYIHQTISAVRFASLHQSPSVDTRIPAKIWCPQIHRTYPTSFQEASKEIMLCSRAKYLQVYNHRPPVNLAAMLPADVWTHVFSFTDRTWFESDQSNVQVLKKRLDLERLNTLKAEHARVEAETRCFIAERERDMYKQIVERIQTNYV